MKNEGGKEDSEIEICRGRRQVDGEEEEKEETGRLIGEEEGSCSMEVVVEENVEENQIE